ncbi:uncharacterized protein LOC113210295 [Frankliniella occidentalis]|uniref:Uncharacterized protein LOC113210295 n=1 Tax=Frankliniella occidentalis TaxID=133901 RepID=A0A6J1SXB4_FRAOC|nr:uncharacterized protein LOC113210295 [Frankliniella occidentalis]
MLPIRKDLFRCGEGRMVFRIWDCDNDSDMSDFIERGGGLAIRSEDYSYDGDGGPYTVSLVNPSRNLNDCTSRDAFSSEFILMCCLKSTILPLKNYWLKKSGRFSDSFDPQDVLLQKISWFDAESLFSNPQFTKNLRRSDSSLDQLNVQPTVKLERITQSAVRTPPLFSEDELSQSQNTKSGVIPINGLVPIIKLERIDESEILEQCFQLWRSNKEAPAGLKKKPLTENPTFVILTSSEDECEVETKRRVSKPRIQKRKFHKIDITDNGSSDSETSQSEEPKRLTPRKELKETSASIGNQDKKHVRRLSLKRPSVSSSSSSPNKPLLGKSKPKLVVKENCENSLGTQDRSPRKNGPHQGNDEGNVNILEAFPGEGKTPLTNNSKSYLWPQNFSSETIKFVVGEATNIEVEESSNEGDNLCLQLESSHSESEEVEDITKSEKDFSVQCDFEEPLCENVGVQTIQVKIVSIDKDSAESLPSPIAGNMFEESSQSPKASNSFEESSPSPKPGNIFAESSSRPKAGNISTEPVPSPKPGNLGKTLVNQIISLSKNKSDLVCQTDFIEPVFCDKVCQTMAVLVQPIPLKDCMVSLEAHDSNETSEEDNAILPYKTKSRLSIDLSSPENCRLGSKDDQPVATPEKMHGFPPIMQLNGLEISPAKDVTKRQNLVLLNCSSEENEAQERVNEPQTPEIIMLSSDSSGRVSPGNNNLQQHSPLKQPKKSPKKLDTSSSERTTRSSLRKETRSYRSSRKK